MLVFVGWCLGLFILGFFRVECHTIVAEPCMECIETELELYNWNSIIVLQLSIISILCCEKLKELTMCATSDVE